MNLLVCLRYALVAFALVRSARGNGETDPPTNATECTMDRGEGVLSANETMYHKLEDCFFLIGYEHLGKNPSDELIRSTFATVCNKSAILATCLDAVDADARECLEASELVRHRLYRQYSELNFEAGCQDYAPVVVEHYRLLDTENSEDNFLSACVADALSQLGGMEGDGPNRFTLHKYAELRKTAECLEAHRGRNHGALANWAIAVCTKVMAEMRCIDQGGNQVLCKTLVVEP